MSETASNSLNALDITAMCQKVIEDCVAGKIELIAVPDNLKTIGITLEVAQDYIKQIAQWISKKRSGTVQSDLDGSWEETLEGLNEDEQEEFWCQQDKFVEEANQQNNDEIHGQASKAAVWVILIAKLASLHSPWISNNSMEQLTAILNLSSPTAASSLLLSTLLSQAPHLAKLTTSSWDLHLDKTWKLWQLFTAEKAVDAIVDIMQQQQLGELIPRSIWWDIIQHQFVNFEKLYALMDLRYDH